MVLIESTTVKGVSTLQIKELLCRNNTILESKHNNRSETRFCTHIDSETRQESVEEPGKSTFNDPVKKL